MNISIRRDVRRPRGARREVPASPAGRRGKGGTSLEPKKECVCDSVRECVCVCRRARALGSATALQRQKRNGRPPIFLLTVGLIIEYILEQEQLLAKTRMRTNSVPLELRRIVHIGRVRRTTVTGVCARASCLPLRRKDAEVRGQTDRGDRGDTVHVSHVISRSVSRLCLGLIARRGK